MVVEPGAFRTRFYDDSLKGTQIKINDYAQTAGTRRKENIVNKHDQQGDPVKGGKVIVETIEKEYYTDQASLSVLCYALKGSSMIK